jgi:hypothetical protein
MVEEYDDTEVIESILNRINSDPRIIPGIHNYCDRWCERCTHTIHCSVFHMEQQLDNTSEGEGSDIDNQKFWEHLSTMFKLTANLIKKTMAEQGIDPEEIQVDDSYNERKTRAKNSKAVAISYDYTFAVGEWIKEKRSILLDMYDLLLNIGGGQSTTIADAIDVLQFYYKMVSTKTYRSFLPSDPDIASTDALGSAKIAIILIDRSTSAWVSVMGIFPEFEDEILDFLKKLSAIKRLILEHLPNTLDYKRPGFDD